MDSRVNILGIMVDRVTMPEALARLDDYIRQRRPRLVVTANAEMVMLAQKDRHLREILNSADLVLADGAGVVWAAGKLGPGVPERVAGFDLTQELLARAATAKYRIFWLGSAPGIAEAAAKIAAERHPGFITVGIHDGYFAADDRTVIQTVRDARPDILLCALGVPKQEKWLRKYLPGLQVPVSIGIGGTFDVMAGKVQRAPLWMQKAGLEWSYRLLRQPSRLIRMLALPQFVLRVLKAAWTSRS
ncbi:MAG: WecB/TagA/CpsF family glycosyltransferase [Veillonellaceae bacterium]|nr:WecB/TagA/CpsF family glycosyltransferase [Veillonellaceae bacterium]